MVTRGRRGAGVVPTPPGRDDDLVEGRRWIAAIGIDGYPRWQRLNNAVNDALGVLAAFEGLGFESVMEPLIDEAATQDAIRCLASGVRPKLQKDDSLVVFFAGHGNTTKWKLDSLPVTRGYLIPVDADPSRSRYDSWERLDHWLSTIAELPPRHILVILDSCHSGIALSREMAHREIGVPSDDLVDPRRQRRSRRVITSADGHQFAMDGGGPLPGHSLFTGFLLQVLRGHAAARFGHAPVSAAELGHYLRSQVNAYSENRQTPVVGVLELDDHGDLLLSLPEPAATPAPTRPGAKRPPGAKAHQPRDVRPQRPVPALPSSQGVGLPIDRTEGWTLDSGFAAQLDRHGDERRSGAHVLSIIVGEAMAAQIAWATWAARHGYLTLATQSRDLDLAIADLLAQTPWLRCLREARRRLARAAKIDVNAVDASLDARSASERRRWIDDVAAGAPHARVSGWLLSALRCANASVLDLTTAPVKGGELLSVACDLAAPTAVFLHHPEPDAAWLERAIGTAAALMAYMPAHSVAVTAPEDLVTRVLHSGRGGSSLSLARQGLVKLTVPAQRAPGRARHRTLRALFEALERDPRTRGRFELDGKIASPSGSPAIEIELVSHSLRIGIELDGWYHFHDPEGYRRDRIQDLRLARAGYFVMRFPAEDVDDRLASTIDQIAVATAGRRASKFPY